MTEPAITAALAALMMLASWGVHRLFTFIHLGV